MLVTLIVIIDYSESKFYRHMKIANIAFIKPPIDNYFQFLTIYAIRVSK
jgi:hypothetical protein